MSDTPIAQTSKLRPNPLNLPTFTFVMGSRDAGSAELIKALVARDHDLEPSSMLTPIYEAASVLVGGDFELFTKLALHEPVEFATEVVHRLQQNLPEFWLARFALNRSEGSLGVVYERIIYNDCTYPFVSDFLTHSGNSRGDIAVIQLGTLQVAPPGFQGRHIWLPMNPLAERLAMLERELGVIP